MSRPAGSLRVAVLQTAPAFADIDANIRDIAAIADRTGLVVTPELSLTGYAVKDLVHELALPLPADDAPGDTLAPLAGTPRAVVAGLIEMGADGVPYNTAVVLGNGRILHRHRKVYLPTYGPFEEGRWFGRGRTVGSFRLSGWRLAVLVCEDFWHPSLAYLAAMGGAHALVVQAAAPGRGVIEEAEHLFASNRSWRELACVSARSHGIYVILANRVGVEDGVTFSGGSVIVGPDGTILAEAPEDRPAVIEAVLDPAELARARRPFAHIRDEDPALLAAALATLERPE